MFSGRYTYLISKRDILPSSSSLILYWIKTTVSNMVPCPKSIAGSIRTRRSCGLIVNEV